MGLPLDIILQMNNLILSEKTLIPLSVFAFLCGGIMWLTTIYTQGQANASDIKDVKQLTRNQNEKVINKLDSIETRLSRIEGKLDVNQ